MEEERTISLMDALADSDEEADKKKKKKKGLKKKKKDKKKNGGEESEVVEANDTGLQHDGEETNEALAEKVKSLSIEAEEEEATATATAADAPGKAKKLSNKERRKMKAATEAKQREMEYKNAGSRKTNFAVSATSRTLSKEEWENVRDIDIPQFTISAYGKTLFQDAQLKIAHGRKYGLVGPNGKGKTTLLKQLANGELQLPPRIDCLYVEQEVTADDTRAVDMVLQADVKRTKLLEKEKKLLTDLDRLTSEDNNEEFDLEKMEQLQQELEEAIAELKLIGNDTAEARALSILYGLGFDAEMQTSPTKNFSGGWRMRVSIARALFVQPTLLLLDEPTNHLDLNAVLWLDDYIQHQFKNTLLVVSHDQDFLDSVCTDIMHLDQKQLFYYRGNYTLFKSQLAQHLDRMKKLYHQQEKDIRALKKSGKSGKKAQEIHAKKKTRESGGAKKNKQKQLDDSSTSALSAKNLLTRPKEYVVQFEFPTPSELSPPIISVDQVSFAYTKGNWLFQDVTFGVDMDSRITIVGKNGVGKSTLLKLITGALDPTEGEIKRNRHVRVGKYHQHFVDVLPMELTPVEYLRKTYPREEVTYQACRNRLGKFGLEGTAHELKMINLSGGQKSRVVFTSLSFQEPHILVLDEPTNNLDLESINALIDAVNAYEGGVILVSHDARLILECEMTLWVCEKQDIFEIENGFPGYKEDILNDIKKEEERQKEQMEKRMKEKEKQRKQKMELLEQKRKKLSEKRS